MPAPEGYTFRPTGAAILQSAAEEAARLHHHYLGTEHLLIALTRLTGGPTERMLQRLGRRPDLLRAELRARAGVGRPGEFGGRGGTLTPRLRRALDAADQAAGAAGLGERELLLAVLGGGPGVAVRVLAEEGPSVADVRAAVEADSGPEADLAPPHRRDAGRAGRSPGAALDAPGDAAGGDTPILDRFGRDLTAAARAGALRELIGRQQELREIARALVRQDRNVPVLVGEAGVGKTAIVEGFALRLARDPARPVIPVLRGKRIVQIVVADLVAGAELRGEFEARVQGLLRECAAHPEVVLFVDEIHTLVGAGHAGGTQDAAQLLKPALANGALRVIGATTPAEYQRYIARDAALERRMQPIRVEEPTPAEAEALLAEAAPGYAAHHGVRIQPAALRAAVELTVRFMPDRRLPDKALDALDDACARVVVGDRLSFLGDEGGAGGGEGEVTAATVATVVAERLGIPVAEVGAEERDRLFFLERTLGRRVVAQGAALRAVAQSLKVSRSRVGHPDRPRGVLLFAGPTGVGKTETARALAEALFGSARNLLTLDMAEFSQEHMVAQLIGSPPGYVGYEQDGRLTGWLRRHPYSVVLFDEIEKAHPAARKLLLGLFDEGRITGGQGTTVYGREAVYILTTNWHPSSEEVAEAGPEGAQGGPPSEEALRAALGHVMTPELVNRVDHVVVFGPLDRDALRSIAQLQIDRIGEQLLALGVTLHADGDAVDWIVAHGTDSFGNARGLARLIDRAIREPIADLELLGRLAPGARVTIALEGERIGVAAAAGP